MKVLKTPKGTEVTREVELKLDDATHAKLSKERGEKLRAKAKLEEEFAEVKTKWADRIKPLSNRLAVLDEFVEHGIEKKTVKCTMVKNHEQSVVEFWFEGTVVDSRPMTPLDRQEDLPIRRGRSTKTEKKRDVRKAASGDKDWEDDDIAQVRKAETSKKTKHSSTDGPTQNGLHAVK